MIVVGEACQTADAPTCNNIVDKQSTILDDVTSHNISRQTRPIQHGDPQSRQRLHTGSDSSHSRRNDYNISTERVVEATAAGTEYREEPAHGWLSPAPPLNVDNTQPTPPHPETAATGPNFNRICKVCESDKYDSANIDLRPIAFANHRRDNWPMVDGTFPTEMIPIYQAVKSTGLPNAMSARVPLPTTLNVEAWRRNINAIGGRPNILDFIVYGFPLGYLGPITDSVGVDNHPSAMQFPRQVQQFIDKEIDKGGVIGPFDDPPFHPWCHVSPLMSRPKANPDDRRIITDMTFPSDLSINAYIIKNGVYSIEMDHELPTVDTLVQHLRNNQPGAYLATLDISRAYKNFNSDPMDWPLLAFQWDGKYYCDITVPFGSRASSCFMQSIANVVTDTLALRGVHAYMYLDDIIIVSPYREKADSDYTAARELLRELGLPEAEEKAQPPSRNVKWLGVNIDTQQMTVSIPQEKLQAVIDQVSRYTKHRSMTKKQLQKLLGHLLHVAKCVHPARLFVSRLLEALRQAKGKYLNVTADMRADFKWFLEFCTQWNGVSYIPAVQPTRDIYVDACLTGIGGADGVRAYAGQVAPIHDEVVNITELEAANPVVA